MDDRGKSRYVLKEGYEKALSVTPSFDVVAWMADTRHLALLDDALRMLFSYDSEIQSIQENRVHVDDLSPRQKAYLDLDIHLLNGQMGIVFTDTPLVTMNELDGKVEAIKDRLPVRENKNDTPYIKQVRKVAQQLVSENRKDTQVSKVDTGEGIGVS